MTVQKSDKLENKLRDVDFSSLSLYAVCAGDTHVNSGWGQPYLFTAIPRPRHVGKCSALWAGYISCYVLDEQGELLLERFEYPSEDNQEPDVINERLKGDFWLIMKDNFYGDRTYVPFVRGKIIADRSQWIKEDKGNSQSSHEIIDKIILEANKSKLIITIDPDTAGSIKDYKIYVDGNVNFAYKEKDMQSDNEQSIRIAVGKHRIIVREFEVGRANRQVSNTIYFEALENGIRRFHLVHQNGELILLDIS